MNALDFILKLNSLAISEKKLREKGYGDHSKNIISAFYPVSTGKKSINENPIIQLIEEYNCSNLTLASSISLNEEISETDRFILIGWVWGDDLLAIDKKSGEIVMLAYWDYNLITFHCAENSDKFLEAFLIHGVSGLDVHFEKEADRWAYNIKKATNAAEAAGGNKYLRFWMVLYPTDNGKSDEPNQGGFLN